MNMSEVVDFYQRQGLVIMIRELQQKVSTEDLLNALATDFDSRFGDDELTKCLEKAVEIIKNRHLESERQS